MNAALGPVTALHLIAATWALTIGAIQLARVKGTASHRVLGWSRMVAVATVAISSFWLHSTLAIFHGFSLIHLLSLWTLFCMAASIYFVKVGNIRRHRRFAVGAYVGTVAAGIGVFVAPGRLLHQWLMGFG